MPNTSIGRALAACAALAILGAGAQTMYKWVDEKGVTHFSEHPPPDDRKATKIEPKVTPPSSSTAAPAGTSADWKAKDAEFRKRQIERGRAEQAESKYKERRQAACERARSRLAGLQNSHRIYRDNPDGTRTFLDDSQREAEVAGGREAVREYCN